MKRISLSLTVLGALFVACGSPVERPHISQTTNTTSTVVSNVSAADIVRATTGKNAFLSAQNYDCICPYGGGGGGGKPIVLPPAPTITTPTGPAPKPIDWGTTIKIPTIPTPTPTPPIVTPPKPTPKPDDCEEEPITNPVGGGTIVPMMGTTNKVDCPPKPKPVPKPTPKPVEPDCEPEVTKPGGGTIVPMMGTTNKVDCPPKPKPVEPDCEKPVVGGGTIVPMSNSGKPDCKPASKTTGVASDNSGGTFNFNFGD